MGKIISIVSGKGGVGKTTVACALGLSFAKSGYSVCVIDLDVGLNNVDVLLGVDNKVVYDIGDYLSGKCRIKQALVSDSRFENLYIMPSERFSENRNNVYSVKELTRKLASVFDYVIIDAPAGMGENFETAINVANECIVVVSPHVASLRDADQVISRIKAINCETYIVINRIRGDLVARKEMLNHNQIRSLLKTEVVGVVPESDEINILSSLKFERISKTNMAQVFSIIAENIHNNSFNIFDYESRYRGLVGLVRRSIKKNV